MRLNPRIRDVMTSNPIFSTPESTVQDVARLMVEANCGEVPICKDGKVVGILTDRDLACRITASGRDPSQTKANEIMTMLPITVFADDPLRSAIDVMEQEAIRRVPVVDADGVLVGIVSQVDVASRASRRKAGQLLATTRPLPLAKI